jgi:transposase
VNRDTVGSWIKKWEHQGTDSLHDKPRSGRPEKLTPDEQQVALGYLKDNPRSLKHVVDRLEQKEKKRISISTLKRLAKRAGLRWKRVRKSLKNLRNPEEFDKCKRELEALQKQGLFAIFEASPKSFHSRPLCAFDGCVHFEDHTPSAESA